MANKYMYDKDLYYRKQQAKKAARELYYGEDVIKAIDNAANFEQVNNALIGARHALMKKEMDRKR